MGPEKLVNPGKMSGPPTKPVKLTPIERITSLNTLIASDWNLLSDRDAIRKMFYFNNFTECFAFMAKVAAKADELNHHPEWNNIYNKVEITWTTHDCQGLSKLDVDMAACCDHFYTEQQM